jgi:hypothetical protein
LTAHAPINHSEPTMTLETQVTVRLSASEREALARLAAQEERKEPDVIRRALRAYAKANGIETAASTAAPAPASPASRRRRSK